MRVLLILAGIGLLVYLFGLWWARPDPARVAQTLRWSLLVVMGALLLLLLARGGAVVAVPLLALLLPMLLRWRGLMQRPVTTGDAGSGHAHSTVQTRFLRMSLDHVSGEIFGTVLEGRFTGREIRDLTLEELLLLWQECQADGRSAAVLEAYLDRAHGNDWRDRVHRDGRATSNHAPMSRAEAYEVLGLQPGASPEEIRAAHRRLMQRVHPDRGGSSYLAARINQAKGCLLGR